MKGKLWRWQYKLRKSIERAIKLYTYGLVRDFTKPQLRNYDTCSRTTRRAKGW